MSDKTYTLPEAHKHFAIDCNNTVWNLWEKKDRSAADDEAMTHAAHASLWHWMHAGKAVHRQRGEWMVAKCYMHRKLSAEALRHAARCLELTQSHAAEMADFDTAFAYELMARVHALAGNKQDAAAFLAKAQAAGAAIKDKEDREVFESQFKAEPWFGLRS